MTIRLLEAPFSPWAWLAQYETEHPQTAGRFGATAVFVGTMRDFNEGDRVTGLFLEHYPGMTERSLETLREAAHARWDLVDSVILHRVGELEPADPIVLVAVWSAHRKDAFEASRWLMEQLKSRAPFWKKERLTAGSRWVEKNTPG